jgi:hypothetical protein
MSNTGFMIGQKGVKYGLTLNTKKAKQLSNKAGPSKAGPSKPIAAFAESDSDDEKNDFRGAADIARNQAKYGVDNARVRFAFENITT